MTETIKERRWRRVFNQWEQSGLNITEFCQQQSISRFTFHHWKRKLLKTLKHPNHHSSAFIPLKEVKPTSSASDRIQLYLSSRVHLCIPVSQLHETLTQLKSEGWLS